VFGVSAGAGVGARGGAGFANGGVVCDGAGVTVVLVLDVVTVVESTTVESGFFSVLIAHAVAAKRRRTERRGIGDMFVSVLEDFCGERKGLLQGRY
jgi:hypothetical protein